jgi:hypothetical protein
MFKPKTTIAAVFASPKGGIERDGRLENSSGGAIRTHDLRVMSKAPESVLFVRRVLQISQTGERWFLPARHAAIVDRYAYSTLFTRVRQFHFSHSLFLSVTILQPVKVIIYSANISNNMETTSLWVLESIFPSFFTKRILSTVRIWSKTICPSFPSK